MKIIHTIAGVRGQERRDIDVYLRSSVGDADGGSRYGAGIAYT